MAALDAAVQVRGPDGSRSVPLGELHRLPGDEPQLDTTLVHGELITAVDLPPATGRSAYRKVRDRASYAFALVSVAAVLDVADREVADVRIALGGSPTSRGARRRPRRGCAAARPPRTRSVLRALSERRQP